MLPVPMTLCNTLTLLGDCTDMILNTFDVNIHPILVRRAGVTLTIKSANVSELLPPPPHIWTRFAEQDYIVVFCFPGNRQGRIADRLLFLVSEIERDSYLKQDNFNAGDGLGDRLLSLRLTYRYLAIVHTVDGLSAVLWIISMEVWYKMLDSDVQ